MAEKVVRLENKHLVLVGAVLVVGFLLFSSSGITGEAVIEKVGKIKVLSVNKIQSYKLNVVNVMSNTVFKKGVMFDELADKSNKGEVGFACLDKKGRLYRSELPCGEPVDTINPPLNTNECVDSDGQDYYKKGSTTGIRYESKITEKNPVITTLTDSCYKYVGHYEDVLSCDSPDCYVTEFYCEIRSGQSMMNEKTTVCLYGCRDGACLREPLDTI